MVFWKQNGLADKITIFSKIGNPCIILVQVPVLVHFGEKNSLISKGCAVSSHIVALFIPCINNILVDVDGMADTGPSIDPTTMPVQAEAAPEKIPHVHCFKRIVTN